LLSEFLGIQPQVRDLLEALGIGVDTLGNDIQSIMDYVDTLETNNTSLNLDLTTIKNDLTTLKGYTDTLETSIGTITMDLGTALVYLERLEEHNHNEQWVYPTLTTPPQLISGSGTAYTLGNFVELIPENAINAPFDLHFFNTGIASGVCTYEVHLFRGSVGNEVIFAKIRFARLTNQMGAYPFPLMTPVFPANTRISGKLATSLTTQETLNCSLAYHHY
jgi:hypothetical protein